MHPYGLQKAVDSEGKGRLLCNRRFITPRPYGGLEDLAEMQQSAHQIGLTTALDSGAPDHVS